MTPFANFGAVAYSIPSPLIPTQPGGLLRQDAPQWRLKRLLRDFHHAEPFMPVRSIPAVHGRWPISRSFRIDKALSTKVCRVGSVWGPGGQVLITVKGQRHGRVAFFVVGLGL